MDEEFDVVICGTGLKECILGGLLSVHGKKVLQIDRNGYYGGESASLNLTTLFEKFHPGLPIPKEYGANRDWNVDLIPKFVMACGQLVKILLHTRVTRYLEWQVVEGTYVYQYQKAGFFSGEKHIHKVPATDIEALKSPLMPLLEKNRCKNFFQFCAAWDADKPSTHKSFNPSTTTMRDVYAAFGLQTNTIDFIGHAVALYSNDKYIDLPMSQTMDKIKLYMYSLARYGQSPFIYPVYGLGTLPESFSRLCAVHGGTFMLNKPISGFVYDDEGKVSGVRSAEGEVVKCKMVVCDPTYVLDTGKVRLVGRVIRCICILGLPPKEMGDATSAQVIIPQHQVGRQTDIYIAMVSSRHGVAKQGKYIALVSTTVETDTPEKEIEPALALLGPIEHKFVQISDLYEPTDDGTRDRVFVSSSYDATSHFESAADDVLHMWERITGSPLDLTIAPDLDDHDS